jgi:hypothetical protein
LVFKVAFVSSQDSDLYSNADTFAGAIEFALLAQLANNEKLKTKKNYYNIFNHLNFTFLKLFIYILGY